MEMSVVVRELDIGRNEVASRRPHPALREYVRGYWGYREIYSVERRRCELPSSEIVVTLSFGPELRLRHVDGPPAMASHTSFVAGLTESPVMTEMAGSSEAMQINLTPPGASLLLGTSMDEVANRIVALDDVVGDRIHSFIGRLNDASSWSARFDLLDAELISRLDRGTPPPPAALFAWDRLVATRGRASVRSLTDALGCSRRYLAAQFHEHVGLTPKTAARLLRFEHARERIERSRAGSLADIALDCGYFDQSHLDHDFRGFAALSPTEFRARLAPEGGLAPE